jgi:hypothetical protein
MQFTDNVGIIGSKLELAALLKFCGESSDKFTGISIKLERGKLLAWATNGISAIYHHGLTFDGAGKPSEATDAWQIPADVLSTVLKAAGNGDELILSLTNKRGLKDALIRDIETSTERGRFDLSHTATNGELFAIEHIVPSRPDRNSCSVGCLNIATSLLELLRKVSKATGSDACRLWMPENGAQPLYVEVDTLTALSDEEQPRWVVVLMPLRTDDESEERGEQKEEPSHDVTDEEEP